MPAKHKSSPGKQIRPRVRVTCGTDIAMGPGKADLLAAIQETGTITSAAQQLGMSYMRAWTLIKTMNRCFREPLVVTTRGGSERGAAALTNTGKAVLHLYREMESHSLAAIEAGWQEMQAYLRD